MLNTTMIVPSTIKEAKAIVAKLMLAGLWFYTRDCIDGRTMIFVNPKHALLVKSFCTQFEAFKELV